MKKKIDYRIVPGLKKPKLFSLEKNNLINNKIEEVICQSYKILSLDSITRISQPTNAPEISEIRMLYCYLVDKFIQQKTPKKTIDFVNPYIQKNIANKMGYKNHSSVNNGVKVIKDTIQINKKFSKKVIDMEVIIASFKENL